MKRRGFVVAIDGPAGSGKSTTAKGVARRLGFRYLDTGAMYRAMTLKALETGLDIADRAKLARLLADTRIRLDWQGQRLRVSLDGRDVTDDIRSPRVSGFVSDVSAIPMVRSAMVKQQRRAAIGNRLVCEGRDIGSVVFPDADLKVYLDCEVGERAGRRERELKSGGTRTSRAAVATNLRKRDRLDSGRKTAPLLRVEDAVLVDTTMLTIEEQVAVVCSLAERRFGRRAVTA